MSYMHNRATIALVSVFAFAPLAQAASGVLLPDPAPALDALKGIEADQDRQDESLWFQESAELFPLIGEEEESPGEERTDGLLIIRIGTKNVTLRDVPLKEWFAPYVRDLAELGLVSGYRDAAGMPTGAYGPADPVTLEQVAKVAVLAAGIDAGACPVPPHNLSASGAWSASYVSCAEAKGWAVFSDAAADLKRSATREEVVMTILQAFNREFDIPTESITFTDVEKTGMYAPAIAKAANDGIVSGYTDAQGKPTGEFGPTNNVTRAEFAKIVSISLQLYGN